MEVNRAAELGAEIRHFEINGEFLGAAPFAGGHINDSYRATFDEQGATRHYIVQRINTRVFTDPGLLMENIERVTAHIGRLLAHEPDVNRRVLKFVPTRDGRLFHIDANGHCWRAMRYIDRTHVLHTIDSPEQAFRIAAAFGKFQQQLTTLPEPRLLETIPHFHDTPRRLADLERAIEVDAVGRAESVAEEIAFALSRKATAEELLQAGMPERVVHNDSKSSNVLLDSTTGEPICVVDLDTVMPGLAVYDFGDMVRSMTSLSAEDEQDLARVYLHFPIFEALVRGFLHTAGTFLTDLEKRMLPSAGKVITFENGVRFLTDYLNGDTYYKIQRATHNLDRCRTHFRLVQSIEEQEENMDRLVDSLL